MAADRQREEFGGEILERVQVKLARSLQDVRDPAWIEAGLSFSLELVYPGRGNCKAEDFPRPAELGDLAQPVLSFVPVALPSSTSNRSPKSLAKRLRITN